MAEEEDKTTVDSGEESKEAAPKKSGNKMILYGGIGAGVLIVGVALALFVVRPMMSGSADAEQDQVENSSDSHAKTKTDHKPKAKKHGEDGASESIVYSIKDIVVNPAGTGGSRFLSVSFGFELESASIASNFENRELMVRDALITILSSKTVAQLTDARQKEIIRIQIKKRLSKLLKTEDINGVYYTDFVLQ